MQQEAVVLLHGLGRTRFSLMRLGQLLSRDYQVVNLGYPSRRFTIETLAEMAITPALERCCNASKVHFVTHSMGGILVRQYLQTHAIDNLGHTVMLGPPNSGSELVDFFLNQPVLAPIFRSINGPAGSQLGTATTDKPTALGKADFSVGIIAGNLNRNPVYDQLMPNEHDGKVSVSSSRVDGMSDHITLPVDHTFMMHNKAVVSQIRHFLRKGCFDHN